MPADTKGEGFTVWLSVVTPTAHCPGSAVKVYVPDAALLTTAGDHDPVMPFAEVALSNGAAVPEQRGGNAANCGTVCGMIVCVSVAGTAQGPAFGVNKYVAEVVLSTTAGDHVPAMPLVDTAGSSGAGVPLQIFGSAANVGMVLGVMVCVSVVVTAHTPAAGVKV